MHSKKIVRLAAVNWAVFVKGFLFQIFTVGIIVAVFSLIVSDFFVAVSGAVAEAGILDAFSGMINGIFDLFNGEISGADLGEAIEKFFGTIKDFFELGARFRKQPRAFRRAFRGGDDSALFSVGHDRFAYALLSQQIHVHKQQRLLYVVLFPSIRKFAVVQLFENGCRSRD